MTTMSTIEVECRGPLSRKEYHTLKEFLSRKGTFVKSGNRLTVMYFRNVIPKQSREIKDEKVDLRVRITNKAPEVVLKYGAFGGSDARKEYSFPLEINNFTSYIEFLSKIGWHLSVVYANTMETYTYKNIEFTLVKIKDYGYVYEAEMLIEDESQVNESKKHIAEILSELQLREYHEGEFEKQCDHINNTKTLQYDFTTINPNIIIEKFSEFF